MLSGLFRYEVSADTSVTTPFRTVIVSGVSSSQVMPSSNTRVVQEPLGSVGRLSSTGGTTMSIPPAGPLARFRSAL